ncbi:uncharacterized protein LOC129912264 [Episyrphus balteatus]|uniref:uncharacterized protein LOC129912264 n=1 Tax=Episyrphus balteatus TaxID=286459 RepID=UPI002486A326|nr:uncharacterized protein LOC129912264 [Episyrphus balteatus]
MAQLNYYHLTFAAKSYTNSAKNYALNVLPRNVGSCQVHKNNQTKLEQCYIDNVQSAVEYVESYLDEAKLSREKSIFNLNSIILSAIQCSFKIEMSVLDAISLTSKKINDCLNGKGKRNILNYYTKA